MTEDASKVRISPKYQRFGEALLQKERRIKLEIAIVSLLWLVGCPLLCQFVDTDSLYGTKTEELCGLVQYSISSSMTGHYSKVLGSISAPLFAVLIVQRSSGGLCSNIKLCTLSRYSRLIDKNKHVSEEEVKEAIGLWNHVVKIELMGYFAGANLIALVVFDSKNFEWMHLLLATIAFFCLGQQNNLIGRLGDTYPLIFPNWHNNLSVKMFYVGIFHLAIMYTGFFFLGTLNDRGRCDIVGRIFGPNATPRMQQVASAIFWLNEYAFAFLCISVQLLKHYEFRIWEIVGEEQMPYVTIVSKYSTLDAMDRFIKGRTNESEVLFDSGITEMKKTKYL